MEGEEAFPDNGGGGGQPDRAGPVEGTSRDARRPRSRANRRRPEAVTPPPESGNPWTQEIRGGRHAESRGGKPLAARRTGHAGKSATGERESQRPTRRNRRSPPSQRDDASVPRDHGAGGTRTGAATRCDSPALSELCAGAVALCSLFYARLKKERRLRDSERRRRVFLFRRSKARERLRFAVMWASGLLAGGEATPSAEPRVWSATIDKTFSRFDWTESFRVTKATFHFLCGQLRPAVRSVDADGRRAVPVEVRLAVTLWHLGSSCGFQAMEEIFGLPCSAIRSIVRDVCEAVATVLTPKLVCVPQGGALRETLKGFECRYGLAQVAGVIGTLHVAIGSPNENTGQFYNTKGWHSVVLQAVVDPDFCFWDLNVGCPGSLSDSQVLVASELYERGTEGTLFPKTTKRLNGIEVPIHLLGSCSYPLLPWLMTPVTKEASAADVELNRRFSSALTLTQIAFGRLKSRWRCLLKCSDVDLPFLPILVTACCTLHNICEGRREPFEDHWLEEASEEELEQPSEVEEDDVETEGTAEDIRTALASGVRT